MTGLMVRPDKTSNMVTGLQIESRSNNSSARVISKQSPRNVHTVTHTITINGPSRAEPSRAERDGTMRNGATHGPRVTGAQSAAAEQTSVKRAARRRAGGGGSLLVVVAMHRPLSVLACLHLRASSAGNSSQSTADD